MGKRIINLGGGKYHRNIEGNYIQGDKRKKKKHNQQEEVSKEGKNHHAALNIDTNGEPYIEYLGGDFIQGDYIE